MTDDNDAALDWARTVAAAIRRALFRRAVLAPTREQRIEALAQRLQAMHEAEQRYPDVDPLDLDE